MGDRGELRILLLSHTDDDQDAGSSLAYHLLAAGLRDLGHRVTLYHLNDIKAARAWYARPPFNERLAIRLLLPELISSFVGRIDIGAYDVIQTPSGVGYKLYEKLIGLVPRPLMISHFHGLAYFDHEASFVEFMRGHCALPRKYRWFSSRLPILWDERGARAADAVVVQNSRDYDRILERKLKPPDGLFHIRLPVHPMFLEGVPRERHYAGRARKVLWCGSWIERKGWYYLAQAFNRICDECDDIGLRIGGAGAGRDKVLDAFSERARPHVEVLPFLSRADQRNVLDASDLFVFPSLSEGFGFAALEAMARGVPVIMTPTGVGLDLEHRQNCWIVPSGSSTALYNALRDLMDDQRLRERIGRNGQRLAREHDISEFATATSDVYRRLLARRGC